MKKYFHYHLPGFLWILVILVLTCLPGNLIPKVPSFLDLFSPDKLVHLFLFAVLLFLLLLGFRKQVRPDTVTGFYVAVSLNAGIFLGGITELMQGSSLVNGRVCSVYDFIANVVGCFLGWLIFVLWARRK
ncbi:MAG: VanZ family protein [Bacteroidetes bacterium]|nr:VanZ family protein [Bacteroidota bacterium]